MKTAFKAQKEGALRGGLRPRVKKHLKIAAFMAPILIFALLFVYYPFLKTLVNSLCAVNDKGEIQGFVGLDNFKYVFGRNDFKKALKNSILITLIIITLIPFTSLLSPSLTSHRLHHRQQLLVRRHRLPQLPPSRQRRRKGSIQRQRQRVRQRLLRHLLTTP